MVDRATLLGIFAALGLLAWAACGGLAVGPGALWQTSSVALVVGGVVCTTLAAVPGGQFRAVPRIVKRAFTVPPCDHDRLVGLLVELAHIARRDGLLSLEKLVERIDDAFLKGAMRMVIDGADARMVEQVCRTRMESTDLRHACGSGVLESMGRSAPVFGMIGTVVGLVGMFGRMTDPAHIGPGVAVAMLTTLYGLVLANVFCLPLARKLTLRSSEELLYKTMTLAGVLAIQAGDNPRTVEQKVRAYLPEESKTPAKRPAGEPQRKPESRPALARPSVSLVHEAGRRGEGETREFVTPKDRGGHVLGEATSAAG